MDDIHEKTKKRFIAWQKFFRGAKHVKLYIKNQGVRSLTVLTITAKPEHIMEIKNEAKAAGFLLGEGYGSLKNETFRIANFPALKKSEIKKLHTFLSRYL